MKHTAESFKTAGNSATPTGVIVTKQIPPHYKGSVIARCIKQSFGPSNSSGQPTITLDWEVLVPDKVVNDFDGKTYDLTSLILKVYLSLSAIDKKGNPTQNIQYLVEDLLPRLGLPAEIDDENPLKSDNNPEGINFVGIIAELYVSANERIEKRLLPSGKYEEVKDSQGNKITRGWEFGMIDKKDILGLAKI